MKKKRLSLIAALALVGLGTFALVKYVSTAEDRALAGEELVEVLVLDRDVRAGTSVTQLQQFVRVESVPVKVRASGALAGLSESEDMVVGVDLVRGEQLTAARLMSATDYGAQQARVGRGGGAVTVPEGLLELTIQLDPIRTVGGTVRPGDTVGLIASFTGFSDADPAAALLGEAVEGQDVSGFLMHKILVTNVQGAPVAESTGAASTAERAPTPTGALLVTLAVQADQAERVVFAASYGDIWLAVEPVDAAEDGTRIRTQSEIFQP